MVQPSIWQNVTTNIGRRFLELLSLHFHVEHPYHRIFNKKTVKVSYCFMPNMGSIISSHNHKIFKSEKKTITPSGACNCDKPEDCPLKGHCMGVQCVVYKATISAPNHAEKYYYGLSEPEFKSRYANDKSSLKYPSKRNTVELSKYYWELCDKSVDKKDIKVDWSIERQAHKYKCGTRRCDLCLTETLEIALADKFAILNKRSEIVSACPHRIKYRYHKVTKVKIKESCVLALCTQYRWLTLNAHSTLDIATMYIRLLTDCHVPFYTWTFSLHLY